jgi:hypothetical protein
MSTYPIVGAFYRPPAKAIMDVLPIGTKLTLLAEPDNNFDPNAIAVWLSSEDIPKVCYDRLEETLPDHGVTLESLLMTPDWHLGYIPRDLAATLKANGTVTDNSPVTGSFSLSPNGSPRVRLNGG